MQKKEIVTLAHACATEAITQGGSAPFDSDGECTLPTEPLVSDWDALREMLGREPKDEERDAFYETYQDTMHFHIDDLPAQETP